MRLVLCGVRGSTPAPGPEFLRYGGHTSCVAIAHDGDTPSLVLDAGTGLRRLTSVLAGGPFRGTLLLGHLHWDHTHGLPFFAAGTRPDAKVSAWLPEQGVDPIEVLARALGPPHFPVTPTELTGEWSFGGLAAGEHDMEGFSILALEIPHKGGRTFGFRVTDGSATIAYLSDHSPVALGRGPDGLGEYHHAALALVSGVDMLLHDAQHTAAELPARAAFGHSAVEYAVGLAEKAAALRLLLFHHDPDRTDDEIDAIVAGCQGGSVEVAAAAEGKVIDL